MVLLRGAFVVPLFILIFELFGCRVEMGPPDRRSHEADGSVQGEVMVYTSMYRHVIDAVKPILRKELPKVNVRWLRGGSEKIATRLDAEIAAGAPQADLILTSDPLWYERLGAAGHLAPYASLRALVMPRALVHPTGHFVTARISTMVLAYNQRLVREEDAPRRFTDLFDPRWHGKVTTPDPLGSGTTFTTLAFLVHAHGPQLLERWKAARTVSSGGNSSTLTRIESGEHSVGFVLLENILKARKNGSPVQFRLPEEGPVLVPGPIAILRDAPNPAAARAVYDLLLSPAVQRAVVDGLMHAAFDDLSPPEGAPPLKTLLDTQYQWSQPFIAEAVPKAAALRADFARIMSAP